MQNITVELIESPFGLFNYQGKKYVVKSGNYQAYVKAKRSPTQYNISIKVLEVA